MNYANQKKIDIVKPEIQSLYNKEGEGDFLHSLSWDKLYPILRQLNGNEFKVQLYCYKWGGKDNFFYSPATLIQDFGLSESTAQRAFKRLEELGFLEKKADDNNGYIFHPTGARMQSK